MPRSSPAITASRAGIIPATAAPITRTISATTMVRRGSTPVAGATRTPGTPRTGRIPGTEPGMVTPATGPEARATPPTDMDTNPEPSGTSTGIRPEPEAWRMPPMGTRPAMPGIRPTATRPG